MLLAQWLLARVSRGLGLLPLPRVQAGMGAQRGKGTSAGTSGGEALAGNGAGERVTLARGGLAGEGSRAACRVEAWL